MEPLRQETNPGAGVPRDAREPRADIPSPMRNPMGIPKPSEAEMKGIIAPKVGSSTPLPERMELAKNETYKLLFTQHGQACSTRASTQSPLATFLVIPRLWAWATGLEKNIKTLHEDMNSVFRLDSDKTDESLVALNVLRKKHGIPDVDLKSDRYAKPAGVLTNLPSMAHAVHVMSDPKNQLGAVTCKADSDAQFIFSEKLSVAPEGGRFQHAQAKGNPFTDEFQNEVRAEVVRAIKPLMMPHPQTGESIEAQVERMTKALVAFSRAVVQVNLPEQFYPSGEVKSNINPRTGAEFHITLDIRYTHNLLATGTEDLIPHIDTGQGARGSLTLGTEAKYSEEKIGTIVIPDESFASDMDDAHRLKLVVNHQRQALIDKNPKAIRSPHDQIEFLREHIPGLNSEKIIYTGVGEPLFFHMGRSKNQAQADKAFSEKLAPLHSGLPIEVSRVTAFAALRF